MQKTSERKRTKLPRDVVKAKKFLKDFERLSNSGKHDMNILKEAMMLLIANDFPLPAEWKDHALKGDAKGVRECHIKGDLLLMYRTEDETSDDLITFMRIGTHSEIF